MDKESPSSTQLYKHIYTHLHAAHKIAYKCTHNHVLRLSHIKALTFARKHLWRHTHQYIHIYRNTHVLMERHTWRIHLEKLVTYSSYYKLMSKPKHIKAHPNTRPHTHTNPHTDTHFKNWLRKTLNIQLTYGRTISDSRNKLFRRKQFPFVTIVINISAMKVFISS